MSSNSYFNNKVVWITGASSGIGEALVKNLSGLGANLILSSRRLVELERVANEANLKENQHLILPLDLEDYKSVPHLAQKALSRYGSVDILINNGGISQRSLVKETGIEVYEKIMNIDYMGTIALTKAVLPSMIEKQSGHIVTVTSVMGIYSSPRRSGYCAAKHALHGFMDSLRAEVYEYNIDVTIVAPGYVQTNISLNAVSGDGSEAGIMDKTTASGIPADQFAMKMISAIAAKKPEVIIAGGKEKGGAFLHRFFPGILRKVIRKTPVT